MSILHAAPENADVVFIGANNDISSSSGKGADRGPAAVRKMLETQVEYREHRTGIVARDRRRIGWQDLGDLNGNRTTDDLGRAVMAVSSACDLAYARKQRPFVIGGDHSNAIGALLAVGKHFDPAEVTILHVDAHHDLRANDADFMVPQGRTPYGPFSHGSALRHAADAGFTLVQVGIRSCSHEEAAYAAASARVHPFYWGRVAEFRAPHPANILKLVRTKHLYVTVDVDGFDPSVMPATGTPVSGGLGWWYGWDLLQAACGLRRTQVIGADICEVAPRDGDTLTELNAAQLAYNIVTWAWCR